jgi:hypothetical protein
MKCEEVQDLLPEYADNQLPEMTLRQIEQHIAGCADCRSEYKMWKQSGTWIQANKDQYASVKTAKSIVDAVMARILSEEKWAIPIGKKVFTLTARMRRIGFSVAMILLIVCGFTLYSNTNADEEAESLLMNGEAVAMNTIDDKAQVISSNLHNEDGTFIVGSEPLSSEEEKIDNTASQFLPIQSDAEAFKPKYGLILSFFGILITVIGMSWMTRA